VRLRGCLYVTFVNSGIVWRLAGSRGGDAGALEVGADLRLLVAPFLEFVGAVFFFQDLALGLWKHERVVREIDLRELVEVGCNRRRSVFGDLRDRVFAHDAVLHAAGVFDGYVEGAED
jgi:hypothetical protein